MPIILIGGLIRTNFLQSEGSSELIVRGDNRNQLPSPSHTISHPANLGSPLRVRDLQSQRVRVRESESHKVRESQSQSQRVRESESKRQIQCGYRDQKMLREA